MSFLTIRDLDRAIAEFHTVIRLNPNYADAHKELGSVLYNKGDRDGEIAEERADIRLNPNLELTHNNLGITLIDQGNVSTAAKELEEFIRLAPNTPSNRRKIDEAKRRLEKFRAHEKQLGNL